MLRGLYCHINYFSKLFLLLALVFSFLLFSLLLGILVLVPFYGPDIISLLSTPDYSNASLINAMKVMQIINMTGGLLLPALIYLWLCLPVTETYLSFNKPVHTIVIPLSALVIIFAQPIIGWANELNSYLSLPAGLAFVEDWMKSKEDMGTLVTEAFLSTTTTGGLLVNVLMIAILPAIAEEVLFRGVMARLFKDWTKNVHLAIFLSSFIFAAIHLQFYGFLPRFILGMGLGYLYFWSGSLWLPMAAHFTNNFLSVIIEFLFRRGVIHTNAENFGMHNAAWLTVISIIGITGMLYYIHNLTKIRNIEG